jgi:hypothetical protein
MAMIVDIHSHYFRVFAFREGSFSNTLVAGTVFARTASPKPFR